MSVGNNRSMRDWVSWSVKFLESLRVEAEPFTLSIGHDTILPSDPFSLILPTTSSFQTEREALRLNAEYWGESIHHSLSLSDITLSEDTSHFIYSLLVDLMSGRLELGGALAATFDLVDRTATWYPELQAGLNLVSDLSLRLALLTAFDGTGWQGYGVSAYIPYDSPELDISLGLAYTDGAVQYGRYLNSYELDRPDGKRLTIFSSLLWENDPIALVLDLQLPYNLEYGGLSWGEDFFSAEFSTTLFGVSLSAGLRLGGIFSNTDEALARHSQSFVALGYSNRAISTTLGLHFDRGGEPSITLSAEMRGYQALFARSGELATSPEWLDITLYTGYYQGPDSSLMIRPTLAFNLPEEARLSLRFPFNLSTEDGRLVLVNGLAGFGFGSGSTIETVYSFFTDLFSLVERFELGSFADNLYFIANRDGEVRPDLLEDYHSYGYDAGLSLNAGFTIPSRASVNLFIDNLELPRIHDVTISMMPMGSIGPLITSEAALDILYSAEDWTADLITRFSMDQYFEAADLTLSLWANTFMELSPTGFDIHITSSSDLEFATGLTVDASLMDYSFTVNGGLHSGRARDTYFDEFSLRDATGLDGKADLEDPTAFISLAFGYTGEDFSVEGEYRVDSFERLAKKEDGADRLRLSAEVDMNDFRIMALFIRKNFVRDVGGIFTPDFWTSLDGVYELSLEKTFGHLGFRAALYLASDVERDEAWLNGRSLKSNESEMGFSLITSLRF